MTILIETAQLVKEKLQGDLDGLAVERAVVGIFFTGVKLTNGAAGVCFTPTGELPEAVCCPSSAGKSFDPVKIKGIEVNSVLSALESTEPIKTATAIATLNALCATCWEQGSRGQYTMREGLDAQGVVRMPEGASVAVVGALVPALKALKMRGGKWWVIEKDMRRLKEDEKRHFVPADRSDEVVSEADVLIITGATLVNHTLEPILGSAREGAEIAVIGPTASLFPERLFERGVRVVGGVWVRKPDALLDVLAAGGSGYHFLDSLATRIVMEKEA